MKYSKIRSLIGMTLAAVVSIFPVSLSVVSCSQKDIVSTSNPTIPAPNSPKPDIDYNPDTDHKPVTPAPSRPTIDGVTIIIENNGIFTEGQTVRANATVSPSGLSGVTYQWSIVGSTTPIKNNTTSSISFTAMKGDNTRKLKVVASCDGREVEKTVTLTINSTPTPPPTTKPEGDKDPVTPAPSVPSLTSVSISVNPSGQVREGTTITATANINDASIPGVTYTWEIISGSTLMSPHDKSVTFTANKSDSGKTLKVTATKGSQTVYSTYVLDIVADSVPAPSPAPVPPGDMMKFNISLERTSGFKFDNANIYFNIYDADTDELLKSNVTDWSESEFDSVLTFEMPSNKRYKVKVTSIDRGKYTYPEYIIVDKNNANTKYQFDPVIVKGTRETSYQIEDVSYEIPFTHDVLDKPTSLEQNRNEGKMTILMYFKTSCPKSRNTLKTLFKGINFDIPDDGGAWVETPERWKKIEVFCFSDVDSVAQLQDYETDNAKHPEFHFFSDPGSIVADKYFHNDLKYPRLAILDYQGVFVERFKGQMDDPKTVQNYIKRYSRPDSVPTTTTPASNVIMYKDDKQYE